MSDTPRTDAFAHGMYCKACESAAFGSQDISPEEGYGMTLDFARQLERELAERTQERDESDMALHTVEAERDAARYQLTTALCALEHVRAERDAALAALEAKLDRITELELRLANWRTKHLADKENEPR